MRQSVLDTDILSYILDDRFPEVTSRARQYHRVFRYFSVSVISIAEVVEGLSRSQNQVGVSEFLRRAEGFEVLPIDFEEAILAGRILAELARSGQRIGKEDPFIAAVAIANRRPLVTTNTSHYQRIVDQGFPLELENWIEHA